MSHVPKSPNHFNSLVEIVAKLRGPGGHPWDQAQTHATLAPYAIEAACELQEAIRTGSTADIIEKTGNLLFQAVLHAQLLSEHGLGTIDEVIEKLNKKMIRRLPHLSKTRQAATNKMADQPTDDRASGLSGSSDLASGQPPVGQSWSAIKPREKVARGMDPNYLDPLPIKSGLPALDQSQKIGDHTARLKFDWETIDQVFAKVDEEVLELKEAILEQDIAHMEHELGDLLFATTQLARHLGLRAEQALLVANRRFKNRFLVMWDLVKQKHLDWDSLNLEAKESLWQEGKRLIVKTAAAAATRTTL